MEKKSRNKIILVIIAIVMIVIFLIVGIITTTTIKKEKELKEMAEWEEQNKRIVPNVVGMTRKEAIEELKKNELEYVVSPYTIIADDAIVTSQSPEAENEVKKGDRVTINVSKQLPSYVEKVNNYMTFNMTISDFVEKLNNTRTYNINPISEDDFRYLGDLPQENGITLKMYLYEQINPANGAKNGKGIGLQIEPTGKIAAIRYLSRSGIYTDDILLQRILNITINRTKDESVNIIEKARNNLGQSFTSNELHFGYQYWDANGVPAFELFAM